MVAQKYIASLKYPITIKQGPNLYRGKIIEAITVDSEAGITKVKILMITNSRGKTTEFGQPPVVWLEDWNVTARQFL